MIETASVIGGTFPVDAVEALAATTAEGSPTDVAARLRALVRKELLRLAPGADPAVELYRFRHTLIRDAAYEAIPKQLRSDLHERHADWLQAWAGSRVEEYEEILGYHLEQAHRYLVELGPADEHAGELAARAGARLAVAGRRAAARGDVSASVGLLRRAARLLPPDDPLRLPTLMGLHDGLLQAGDIERSGRALDDLLTAARGANDRVFEQRALLGRLWLRFLTDPRATTVDELRSDVDAIIARSEALGDDAGVARALEPLATIHWLTGNASAMLDASERALHLAAEAGERRVVTAAVSYVGRALVLGTTPCSRALERLEELAAELEDDATAQAAARLEIATLLSMLGRFDEARSHAAIARETFQDLGQRRWLAGAEETSGLIAWAEGRLEDAAREIRASYAFFRGQDDAANATPTASDLAQVLCELGRYEEAGDLADEVRTQAGTYDLEPQIGWRCVRARVLARQGSARPGRGAGPVGVRARGADRVPQPAGRRPRGSVDGARRLRPARGRDRAARGRPRPASAEGRPCGRRARRGQARAAGSSLGVGPLVVERPVGERRLAPRDAADRRELVRRGLHVLEGLATELEQDVEVPVHDRRADERVRPLLDERDQLRPDLLRLGALHRDPGEPDDPGRTTLGALLPGRSSWRPPLSVANEQRAPASQSGPSM